MDNNIEARIDYLINDLILRVRVGNDATVTRWMNKLPMSSYILLPAVLKTLKNLMMLWASTNSIIELRALELRYPNLRVGRLYNAN